MHGDDDADEAVGGECWVFVSFLSRMVYEVKLAL
jgi:hypothetical protein